MVIRRFYNLSRDWINYIDAFCLKSHTTWFPCKGRHSCYLAQVHPASLKIPSDSDIDTEYCGIFTACTTCRSPATLANM